MKQGGRPTILTHALSTAFCGLFIEFKTDQIINVTIFMSDCGLNGTVSKCRHKCLELVMHCTGFSSKEGKGMDTAKECTICSSKLHSSTKAFYESENNSGRRTFLVNRLASDVTWYNRVNCIMHV